MADGLPGEGRFIDLHLHGLQQEAISTDLIARREQHQVAHNDLAARNLLLVAIADDTHGFAVVLQVQQRELSVSLPFKPEGKACGQRDGDDDADRFEEGGGISP